MRRRHSRAGQRIQTNSQSHGIWWLRSLAQISWDAPQKRHLQRRCHQGQAHLAGAR